MSSALHLYLDFIGTGLLFLARSEKSMMSRKLIGGSSSFIREPKPRNLSAADNYDKGLEQSLINMELLYN